MWSDERIMVGDQWRSDLDDAVRRATLALVLVSGDLFASRFIMDAQLPVLRERGVRTLRRRSPN